MNLFGLEFDTMNISLGLNFLFFIVFYRLWGFFDKPGTSNFLIDTIKVTFNRMKGASLIVGSTMDRSLNIYWRSENMAIRPNQSTQSLPLQFEPRNLFHVWKSLPGLFAFQGSLSNTNPLEDGNDDIELAQIAQANEVYVEAEVERRIRQDNPFTKIMKLQHITLLVMAIGFIVLAFLFNEFQTGINEFQAQVMDAYNQAKPAIDQFIQQQSVIINENIQNGLQGG